MFCITLNLIPTNMASSNLNLQLPIWLSFLDSMTPVVRGQRQADAVYFDLANQRTVSGSRFWHSLLTVSINFSAPQGPVLWHFLSAY
jgi:hypothetical protein